MLSRREFIWLSSRTSTYEGLADVLRLVLIRVLLYQARVRGPKIWSRPDELAQCTPWHRCNATKISAFSMLLARFFWAHVPKFNQQQVIARPYSHSSQSLSGTTTAPSPSTHLLSNYSSFPETLAVWAPTYCHGLCRLAHCRERRRSADLPSSEAFVRCYGTLARYLGLGTVCWESVWGGGKML